MVQAGYGVEVAQGLYEYVTSSYFEEPTQETESQMSQAKRARTSSTKDVAPGVKQYVKGCMNRLLENKVLVIASSGTVTPGVAGTVTSAGLGGITQGTGGANRTGDIIHLKHMRYTYAANDTAPGYLRLCIVIDRLSQGVTPAVLDVLQAANVYAQYNTANVIGYGGGRFKVIHDEVLQVNPTIAATSYLTPVKTRLFKKEVDMPIVYNGNSTGTSADLQKNAIWYIFVGSSATINVVFSTCVNFVDN